MTLFRLALPAAVLAAAMGASIARADDNPVRQFLNEEFANAATQAPQEQENAPAAAQVANVSADQQTKTKADANPWAGMTTASAAPVAAPVRTPAPAVDANAAAINLLIEKHASANGIPAAFVRAVVRIESNYNPRATGSHREVGLMQIKYETARGIGYTGTREELYDPDTNLRWGTKYLAMSWKLGGSTTCGAVMKYQGGHAVTRMSPAANVYCAKVKAHMASAN